MWRRNGKQDSENYHSRACGFKGMTPARRPPSTVEVDSGCGLSFDAVSVDLHRRGKRLTTTRQRPPPLAAGAKDRGTSLGLERLEERTPMGRALLGDAHL